MKALKKEQIREDQKDYPKFKKIDGRHPLKDYSPDSFIEYKARKRRGGKVSFFNFDLAREMGLITKGHLNKINNELEKEILNTFSIIIINEYDEINNIVYPKRDLLPHKYMATRYLQLQHPNKSGATSGDGRSIWNGVVKNKGITWDISSCGTGATRLSPATSLQGKFFCSGDPTISYGCGYSEKDEGLETLFFSEVFHKNNMSTERVLAIIEFADGISINVRAHRNLLRPSHLLRYLKLNDRDNLENIIDYYIDREIENKSWPRVDLLNKKEKYSLFLERTTETFAKLAADLEDHYIFCWIDWDGDNILMDGGIIDYGSIRQFGLFHHEYRYDDDDRYSTSIKEQKDKAKYIIQNFAQMVDFIEKGKKKCLDHFKKSKYLKKFETHFRDRKNYNLLYKIGHKKDDIDLILENKKNLLEKMRKDFSYFEMAKSHRGIEAVTDGINCSAIFCMRDILRVLPQLYLSREKAISEDEFLEIIKSNYAEKEDLQKNTYRNNKINSFQKNYLSLLNFIAKERKISSSDLLLDISMRSSVINKYDRVTGDSISTIVEKVSSKNKSLKAEEIFSLVMRLVEYQDLDPDHIAGRSKKEEDNPKLFKTVLEIVRDYREGL